jgi:hypothetical protein
MGSGAPGRRSAIMPCRPRLLAATALALSLALPGCGPKIEASARTEGPFVRVQVYRLQPGDLVQIGTNAPIPADEQGGADVELPAEEVGAGERTVDVRVERKGHGSTKKVKVTVGPDALAPFLQIGGCHPSDAAKAKDDPRKRIPYLHLEGVGWTADRHLLYPQPQAKNVCRFESDGRVRVDVTANADAQVTVDGEPIALTRGRGEATLGLRPILHGLSLRSVLDAEKRVPLKGELPAQVTHAGATKSVRLALSIDRDEAESVLEGQLRTWQPGMPLPWPRSETAGPARAVVLVASPAPVQVDGQTRHLVPTPTEAVGPAEARGDEVDLVARATAVGVTKLPSCGGYRTFGSSGGLANVRFTMGVEIEVYDRTGASIAKRRFPAPPKGDCPSSLSGRRGETIVLQDTPELEPIRAWLSSVRAAH